MAIISSRVIAGRGAFVRISQRNILQQPFRCDSCAAYVHVGTAVCCYTRKTLIRIHQTNTEKCTHTLLNHQLINTIRNSNMFQPLKGHLQGV